MTRIWQQEKERGTPFLLRILLWIAVNGGRTYAHWVLRVIVFYYVIFAKNARHASRDYLQRWQMYISQTHPSVHPLAHKKLGFWDTYDHLLRFAQVAVDRFYFLSDRTEKFSLHYHNADVFDEFTQGGILITAHMGSFDALRSLAKRERGTSLRIRILLDVAHNANALALLRELDPALAADVIDARQDGPSLALSLQAAIEQGHWVGIMGDRLAQNDRAAVHDFLGAPAKFPVGLWQIAALMQCPVIACMGLFSAPARYDLYFEVITSKLGGNRKTRAADIEQAQLAYIDFLTTGLLTHPDNWFNFYDFWQ